MANNLDLSFADLSFADLSFGLSFDLSGVRSLPASMGASGGLLNCGRLVSSALDSGLLEGYVSLALTEPEFVNS